jgi:hypothetical protein
LNDSQQRRPAFAEAFPRTPELDSLVESFARGDYAEIRRSAPGLAKSSPDAFVRQAAETLLARTRPDPLVVTLLAIAGALVLTLSAWWIANGKPPVSAPPHVEHVHLIAPH